MKRQESQSGNRRRRHEKSHMRLSPLIMARINQLGTLLTHEDRRLWQIGDILVDLHRDRISFKFLAKRFGRRSNRLNEICLTAKEFTAEERNPNLPFSFHEMARVVARKFGWDKKAALAEIASRKLTQRRQVSSHFAQIRERQNNQRALQDSIHNIMAVDPAGEWVNQCHQMDCRELLKQIQPGTVDGMVFFDPPYGRPTDLRANGSVCRMDCDNEDPEAAIQLTLDGLRLGLRLLGRDVPLLLCQAGGLPLRLPIHQAAIELGYDPEILEMIWDKKRGQPGRFNDPISTSSEKIFVLRRKGDRLFNRNGTTRQHILGLENLETEIVEFSSVQPRATHGRDFHRYMKPSSLCRFIIEKFTYAGQLCLDLCGCSGNFSIAAAQLNRPFIYTETNANNFAWGSQRVHKEMTAIRAQAG